MQCVRARTGKVLSTERGRKSSVWHPQGLAQQPLEVAGFDQSDQAAERAIVDDVTEHLQAAELRHDLAPGLLTDSATDTATDPAAATADDRGCGRRFESARAWTSCDVGLPRDRSARDRRWTGVPGVGRVVM